MYTKKKAEIQLLLPICRHGFKIFCDLQMTRIKSYINNSYKVMTIIYII